MITDAILNIIGWFFVILWSPLSLIPDGSVYFDRLTDVLEFFLSYSYGWDFILPVSEALMIFRISIAISFGISIYYGVLFVVRLIRGN